MWYDVIKSVIQNFNGDLIKDIISTCFIPINISQWIYYYLDLTPDNHVFLWSETCSWLK